MIVVTRSIRVTLVLTFTWIFIVAAQAHAAPKQEQGTFVLHKFARAIGKEDYTIQNTGRQITVSSDFLFTDRGTRVPLKTVFVADEHLRPIRFSSSGKSSRQSTLNEQIEVRGNQAAIAEDGQTVTRPAPPLFFTMGGYSPAIMQQMLLDYWLGHGQPKTLPIFPLGSVQIQKSGKLNIQAEGNTVHLQGYTVSGLIWGEESLWLDSSHRLAAVVTTDAEFDHFEAVRSQYESALPIFIGNAVTSDLAVLNRLASGAKVASAREMAIVGGTLIDGLGGPPIPNAVVVTSGDKIVAAGPRKSVQIPPGATVLHAEGKTILPGLWDMHAHYEQVEWGPIYLASGVTTVRDMGNEFAFITAVRDAIANGKGLGPQIEIAGLVDGTGPYTLGAVTADDPEQVKTVVDRYHSIGALQIKIYSSMKPALVPLIAAEAHRLGMSVTGHVPTGMTAIQAVEAGMDQIDHVPYIAHVFYRPGASGQPPTLDFDSTAAKKNMAIFQRHRTVVDPTLAISEWSSHPANVPVSTFEPGVLKVAPQLKGGLTHTGVPPARAAMAKARFDGYLDTVRALHEAGIRIVAGTDQTVPGYSLHRELELYVKAGFTPMQAIQAATIVPAEVLGLSKTMGSIEPGKVANILIVNGDPLKDIANTRNVYKTIAAGEVYDPAPLWQSVGFQP